MFTKRKKKLAVIVGAGTQTSRLLDDLRAEVEREGARRKARTQIVEAARTHAAIFQMTGDHYSRRRIQQAVFTCRQNRLVPEKVLLAAGFRGYKVKGKARP